MKKKPELEPWGVKDSSWADPLRWGNDAPVFVNGRQNNGTVVGLPGDPNQRDLGLDSDFPIAHGLLGISDSFLDIRITIGVESGNLRSPGTPSLTLIPPKIVTRRIVGGEADLFMIDPDTRKKTIRALLEYFCQELDKMGKE